MTDHLGPIRCLHPFQQAMAKPAADQQRNHRKAHGADQRQAQTTRFGMRDIRDLRLKESVQQQRKRAQRRCRQNQPRQ